MASKKPSNDPQSSGNLTTRILVQIRDEMRQMREDLHRLERRQNEDAMRLATELGSVAHAVVQVRDLLRDQRLDKQQIQDHERRIRSIERKIA